MRHRLPPRLQALASMAFAAAVATIAGCASTSGVEQEQVYTATNGFAVVDTFTYVATVTAVDTAKRKLTVTTKTMQAHKTADLSGLSVGDSVTVEYAESLIIATSNG
jgi:hypothetical protein